MPLPDEKASAAEEFCCSIVVPAGPRLDGLSVRLGQYAQRLAELNRSFEILLVLTHSQAAEGAELAAGNDRLVIVQVADGGWGTAVRAGLAQARGEVLCYLNWERTSPEALARILTTALSSPGVVFRANRRTRDTVQQRLGSLLFNLECRALLGTGAWDVNGTPKVFARRHTRLLSLRRDDDLIDAEFALVCEQEGYAVAEIPIDADPATGHVPIPDYRAALRIYLGVIGLARASR